MKKKLIIMVVVIVFCISMLLMLPSQVFADMPPGEAGSGFLQLSVVPSDSESDTIFTLWLFNLNPAEIYGYGFAVYRYNGTIEQLSNENDSDDFIVYEEFSDPISGSVINLFKTINVKLPEAHYIAFAFAAVYDGDFAWDYKEFDVLNPRSHPMTCSQVWINEDNNFQFIFWWPFRDNNWVKIYDMSGKEVFSIDMPYDNPNLIVDLPDGMYTIKTFNVDPSTPIQTFVIGK